MARKTRTLWATTEYHGVPVYIWKAAKDAKLAAWTKARARSESHDITITPYVFARPAVLDETVIHEFIHVVEHYHSVAELSPARRGGCTRLAVVMGQGLAELFRNLKFAEAGADAPSTLLPHRKPEPGPPSG